MVGFPPFEFAGKVAKNSQTRRIHPQTPPGEAFFDDLRFLSGLLSLNARAVPLLIHGTHTVASRLPVSAPGGRNRTPRLFMLDFIRGHFQFQEHRAICNRAVTKPTHELRRFWAPRGYIIIYRGFVVRSRATGRKSSDFSGLFFAWRRKKARAAAAARAGRGPADLSS